MTQFPAFVNKNLGPTVSHSAVCLAAIPDLCRAGKEGFLVHSHDYGQA